MFKNPFSYDGRIRRLEYGLSRVFGWIPMFILHLLARKLAPNSTEMSMMAVIPGLISYFWFITAQNTKRCHDMGNSGWWILIPLYSLWLIFADGQPGSNQYGENPKGL